MKTVLFTLLMLCSVTAFGQKGITFEVEKLSKPKDFLMTKSHDDIYKEFILSETKRSLHQVKREKVNYPFNIIAKSETSDCLVYLEQNSFFKGMYRAYADHRPFVLSPDMIWLLISQGFARHVTSNHESMRSSFVDFSGKLSLVVKADKPLGDSTFSWEQVFSDFSKQIKTQVGDPNLVDVLTCDFSTTTSVERIASEITIMETVKPYFEFVLMYIACGIPEITLEGTPADWAKVLKKAKGLKKYELEWWISELEPLLKEFLKASKGEVDKEFWRNMFKYHTEKKYGAPNIIDGWIVKFFPYDKHGKRNSLKQLVGTDCLPEEIVKVDVKYQEVYNGTMIETPIELWAGFIGLKQNSENYALRPQIGWMVRKKDVDNKEIKNKLKNDAMTEGLGSGINIRVNEFPSYLLELEEIKQLEIQFVNEIDIPDALSKVKIESLELSGEITEEGIERIKRMFPNIYIRINNELIARNPNSKPLIQFVE